MNRESVGVRGVMGELVKPGAGAAAAETKVVVAAIAPAAVTLLEVVWGAAASMHACLFGPSFGQSPFALCAKAEDARKINKVRARSTFFILFLAGVSGKRVVSLTYRVGLRAGGGRAQNAAKTPSTHVRADVSL
jgi:hypothetical protein